MKTGDEQFYRFQLSRCHLFSRLVVASLLLDPSENRRLANLYFNAFLSSCANESISFLVYVVVGSCECSDATDTISRQPDTPLCHGLEGLDETGTIMNPAFWALDEQSSERPRSDSDYEEPVLNGACAAIGSQSKGREKDVVYENANPTILTDAAGSSNTLDGNDEYCYSYTTDLSLKDEKSRSDEGPKTDGPLHHSLEGPNAGYEALEGAQATTNGYTPMEGLTESSGYQPLQKPTRPVYQSLRKTTTEAPRGAITRK